jgi:hypothetical protein
MTSPALEFVKATTHIMSLEKDLKDEVDAMKRMLLTQVEIHPAGVPKTIINYNHSHQS